MEEIWKDIISLEGKYQISNFGRVKGIRYNREKIISQSITKQCYLQTVLCGKLYRISRAVAIAFIQNTENKPEVNHIDGVKLNNYAENLEWVTSSENSLHSFYSLKRETKLMGGVKPVIQLTKKNEFVAEFRGVGEASRVTKINDRHISECSCGTRKSAGGFKWECATQV